MGSEENFFATQPSFDNFAEITLDRHFRRIPEDWGIFITDVVNSAGAIEGGRYRDVNKIGAASITVVREALDRVDFPFTFGGDGAALVVPPGAIDDTKRHLMGLRELASDRFELDLRVGFMTVTEVREQGVELEVAKLQLSPGRDIAIFRGGGISRASDLIKENRADYSVDGMDPADVELTGLSCRWRPIPAEEGTVMTILVRSRVEPSAETYNRIIDGLDTILDGGLTGANPVNPELMNYRTIRECLADEVRYHSSVFTVSFMLRFLEILLAVAFFKFGLNPVFFDPDKYQKALRTHSDYRKFDDMLRLIIDCDASEVAGIESYLASQFEDGTIFYGIQTADESLMTCYVETLEDGGHLHFVDGGSGGYVSAARQLKQQVREAAEPKETAP